jgi:enoyl-CoA hydratase
MIATDSREHLQVERAGNGVVTIRLDNPEHRNAMSAAMTASWAALMTELRHDRSVRAVVVTGAGSAFSTGGDTDLGEQLVPLHRAWLAIQDLEVPTIAAINGPAAGAGLCLALATDLRYAAEGATLSLLTGRVVTGAEAVGLGLVNRAFPAADLAAEVTAIADSVAACAPIPTRRQGLPAAREKRATTFVGR